MYNKNVTNGIIRIGGVDMKKFKKLRKTVGLAMVLAMTSPIITPFSNEMAVVEAAVKISKSSATLEVGKTLTLKITGSTSKPTWTSSKTSVATVNKTTGKVTAKKAGTATITGKIGSKKYTCKVTVKNFLDQKVTMDDCTFYMPKNWEKVATTENGVSIAAMYPKNANINSTSSVTLTTYETVIPKPDIEELKLYYKQNVTKETQEAALKAQYGVKFTIEEVKTTYAEKYNGILAVTSFTASASGVNFKFTASELWLDNRLVNVTITDRGEKVTPTLAKVRDHILKTFKVVE